MDVERLGRQSAVDIGKKLYVIAAVELLFTKEAHRMWQEKERTQDEAYTTTSILTATTEDTSKHN